jgi:hypothetical protein
MMISRVSSTYPNISGIIITGGLEPSDTVKKLIGGLSGFHIPILAAEEPTYEVALKVRDMPVSLFSTDRQKLELVNFLVREHFDYRRLFEMIRLKKRRKLTPVVFLHDIMEQARAAHRRIVLPEGNEPRTLKATERILERARPSSFFWGIQMRFVMWRLSKAQTFPRLKLLILSNPSIFRILWILMSSCAGTRMLLSQWRATLS